MVTMTYELIPLLPLASFLILGIFGHWIKDKAHLVAVPAVMLSLGCFRSLSSSTWPAGTIQRFASIPG